MIHSRFSFLPVVGLLASAAVAQVPPLVPFPRTLDLLMVDSTFDGVWRLSDLAQDGDYNGAAEIVAYYDDTIGSVALTNPACIAVGPDGTAYIADTTVDVVLRMRDGNGNGNALDAGEHAIFFDGSNAAGIVLASIQGMTVDAVGRVYLAMANTSTAGIDSIIQLFDQNADGDANDVGEAIDYCTIPNGGGAVGDSIPTKVVVAPDGNLYYTEVGATGVLAKGVYQLRDVNQDGDCNDPGEVNLFWQPPAPASNFYYGLAVDVAGTFYVTDHGNETVWRGRDNDGNGVIDATEETLFYQTAGSTWWDVVLRDDGAVLLCEDQTPDRVVALRDLNADGDALDAGEVSNAYDSTVSSTIARPRGAAFLRAPLLDVQPNTVQVGGAANLVVRASKAFDFALVSISLGLVPPTPVPPFGTIEIDVSFAASLAFGIANAAADLQFNLAVPANPALVGSYAFQTLSGDFFRTFLSNAAVLNVNP